MKEQTAKAEAVLFFVKSRHHRLQKQAENPKKYRAVFGNINAGINGDTSKKQAVAEAKKSLRQGTFSEFEIFLKFLRGTKTDKPRTHRAP